MKYSILLLFSILILSCNENESRENIFYPIPEAKHFDYSMIDSLHIDKMKSFWDTNSEKFQQLIDFAERNSQGWESTIASYVSDISISQSDLR